MRKLVFIVFFIALGMVYPVLSQDLLKESVNPDITVDENEQLAAEAQSNPIITPLLYCFQANLEMSIAQITENMNNKPEYYSILIKHGGFTGVGEKVRQGCNQILEEGEVGEENNIIKPTSDDIKRANQIFITYLLQKDTKFYDSCANKPDNEEWQTVRADCLKQKNKFGNIPKN